MLKRMNNSYPENTVDFDEKFTYLLAAAVFDKQEMKNCLDNNDLRFLNRYGLKFVKGNISMAYYIYPILILFFLHSRLRRTSK